MFVFLLRKKKEILTERKRIVRNLSLETTLRVGRCFGNIRVIGLKPFSPVFPFSGVRHHRDSDY